MYFGTYTGFTYMNEGLPAGGSHSKGIYVSRFKPATGELSKPELAAEIVNPALSCGGAEPAIPLRRDGRSTFTRPRFRSRFLRQRVRH